MNAIIQRGTWEGCRPFSADERLALWASRYYASGHHRERSKPRIRVKAETQKPIETNETERGEVCPQQQTSMQALVPSDPTPPGLRDVCN